jgi:hypothetical protein
MRFCINKLQANPDSVPKSNTITVKTVNPVFWGNQTLNVSANYVPFYDSISAGLKSSISQSPELTILLGKPTFTQKG